MATSNQIQMTFAGLMDDQVKRTKYLTKPAFHHKAVDTLWITGPATMQLCKMPKGTKFRAIKLLFSFSNVTNRWSVLRDT